MSERGVMTVQWFYDHWWMFLALGGLGLAYNVFQSWYAGEWRPVPKPVTPTTLEALPANWQLILMLANGQMAGTVGYIEKPKLMECVARQDGIVTGYVFHDGSVVGTTAAMKVKVADCITVDLNKWNL